MKAASKIIPLLLVAALGLGACGGGGGGEEFNADRDYVGMCFDEDTHERVPDSNCNMNTSYDNGGGGAFNGFLIGYLLANSTMPRYGQVYNDYSRTVPAGRHIYRGGVPANGGRLNYNNYRPVSSNVKGAAGTGFANRYKSEAQKRVQQKINRQKSGACGAFVVGAGNDNVLSVTLVIPVKGGGGGGARGGGGGGAKPKSNGFKPNGNGGVKGGTKNKVGC